MCVCVCVCGVGQRGDSCREMIYKSHWISLSTGRTGVGKSGKCLCRVAVGSIIHVEFTSAYVWLLIYGRRKREGRTQLIPSTVGLCVLCVSCLSLPGHVGYTTFSPNMSVIGFFCCVSTARRDGWIEGGGCWDFGPRSA